MNKRIVFLSQYYPPEMGAPQNRLYETIKGLSARGWQVLVVTAMPNYPSGKISQPYRNKLWVKETLDDITVFRTWLYASNSKKNIPRIISMLSFSITCFLSIFTVRKFKAHYILTESPPLTLALSGLVLSKLSNSKHILNVSDIWPLSALELGAINKGVLYQLLEKLEQFVYKKSYAGTGQSQQIIEHLTNSGMERVQLYRNGVDTLRFTETCKKENKGNLKIVYAGLLGVAQGIYNLATQINYAQLNVEFHIYGDGAERKDIEAFINANKQAGVFYHSKVDRTDIPYILSQYDCTIIPLIKPIYGAVPSKIYEAMASGLPIIFAGGGEGADIINKYNCGWTCNPNDFKAISEIIESITKGKENILNDISDNCKYAAATYFNRNTQIETLDYFLTSHAHNNRSRS